MDVVLGIPSAAWNTGGAFVLLFLLFVGLMRGWIVTSREIEGRLKDKDETIAVLRKTVDVKDDQIEKLSIVHEFQKRAWAAVEKAAAAGEDPT